MKSTPLQDTLNELRRKLRWLFSIRLHACLEAPDHNEEYTLNLEESEVLLTVDWESGGGHWETESHRIQIPYEHLEMDEATLVEVLREIREEDVRIQKAKEEARRDSAAYQHRQETLKHLRLLAAEINLDLDLPKE